MARYESWMPRSKKKFHDFANKFCDKVEELADVLGLSLTDKNRLASLLIAFNEAYATATDPETRGPAATILLNAAMKALDAQMRHIKRSYIEPALDNGLITLAQYIGFGLTPADDESTPVADPESRALLYGVQAVGGFAVRFHFRDEHIEHSQAVLPGCNGCVVFYAYGPEKIDDVTQLIKTKLFTSSPARIQLPPDAEGQWLSMAPRWQLNKDGILGPWGPIEHVRVT
jgi:hypothetical protein